MCIIIRHELPLEQHEHDPPQQHDGVPLRADSSIQKGKLPAPTINATRMMHARRDMSGILSSFHYSWLKAAEVRAAGRSSVAPLAEQNRRSGR
jgi:hypothetical protein